MVICSFRSKALKRFAAKGDGSKLPVQNHDRVRRQLAALDAASVPEDLDLPGYRFHGLEGEPKRYAVSVTGNYRLTWSWDDGDATDVDLEDYH
jgi:proteic killer suppression protein